MSAFVSSAHDRQLELADLLRELVAQGRTNQDNAEQCLAIRRSAVNNQQHPLEFLAAQQLDDLKNPGKKLELEGLTSWLAEQCGQPFLRIDPLKINVAAITPLMSYAFAQRHKILAVAVDNDSVTIASSEPLVNSWEANLTHVLKRPIKRVVASPTDIQRFTVEFYRLAKSVSGASAGDTKISNMGNFEQLLNLGAQDQEPDANDAHIVNIVDWLFQYAFTQRASDIHIEPRREQGSVRFRIDGVLHTVYQFPPQVTMAIVSRLKSLGRMNVAEKRKPQDGRVKTKTPDGGEVELRLSTLPTAFGEKMVMRIFDPEVLLKSFDQLGFSADDLKRWQSMTSQPNGIILVTGPTGSGKTTTLYTTLKQLATPEVNVCTIEDPIEMIEGAFNQMQVQSNIDLTFASGVRALMRQDPDIIMVGEIRDLETADISIKAAQTGHLVLSTLHTNDAPTTLTRMRNMGIAPFNIASSVILITAQRLARRLCPQCKEPADIPREALIDAGYDDADIDGSWVTYRPVGCPACNNGYKGRVGIYQVMPISEEIQRIILQDGSALEIAAQAKREGVRSLRGSGLHKARQGLTSLEEVLAVTNE